MLVTVLDFFFSTERLEIRTPPAEPLDAIVVPGCPSRADGSLSGCQARRAMWAAVLWERGFARRFITSGGAVYTPFVEAEALAAAMTALGVPAEHIYLDPHALHTDENVYNALRIAQAQGWSRLAVASDPGQAVGGCLMMGSWGGQCGSLTMDTALVHARVGAAGAKLAAVRAPRVPDAGFVPIKERERARAKQARRLGRPPSLLLYPWMRIRSWLGSPWLPFSPARIEAVTWAERLAQLATPR